MAALRREAALLAARPLPPAVADRDAVRALLVPSAAVATPPFIGGVHILTQRDFA